MCRDHLTIDEAEPARPPGHPDPAVIRRFDAPEAPEAPAMRFYRGCGHASLNCVAGETPILVAGGSHRPIAALRVGDEIYGTERQGRYRRYGRTRVLAHWSSVKPAFGVVLEDGTELIASGDHRFLTQRGWKHVTGAQRGRERRPHLTIGSALLGTGRFVDGPQHSDDYERGYLRGIVRGEGTLGSRARLAPVDGEALDRAERYLYAHGAYTLAGLQPGADRTRAIVRQLGSGGESVRELLRWPLSPSDEWRKGFLAGMCDARGSGAAVIRISGPDETIVGWIESCMHAFGFRTVREGPRRPNGVRVVRLTGGLRERLRFFHLVDPALRRKLDIDAIALTSDARTVVASIEPLATDMQLYDITTGTGDFIANGVVSHNCSARPAHRYLDVEREIHVEVNAPEVPQAELARPFDQRLDM